MCLSKVPAKLEIYNYYVLTYVLVFVKLEACKNITRPESSGLF